MRRILIDECINPQLADHLRLILPEFSIDTVRGLGWAGLKDHLLVSQIQDRFDVFVTIDKGFEFEHNLEQVSFGIIVLETANNQMPSYLRILEKLAQLIQVIGPGQVSRTSDPER